MGKTMNAGKEDVTILGVCPKCHCDDFGTGNGEPVTVGGWYGDRQFNWGRYAGIHMVRLTAKRCPDCGHIWQRDVPGRPTTA